jgi:hypothetical protein
MFHMFPWAMVFQLHIWIYFEIHVLNENLFSKGDDLLKEVGFHKENVIWLKENIMRKK